MWTPVKCTITKQKGFQLRHIYSSFRFITATLQFQWRVVEEAAPVIQSSHFNHFQTINTFNLTHRIIHEWLRANSQFSQLLTILQVEFTIYIHFKRVPVQPSRKGGRRFPVSLLLLDAVCYDEQLLLRDTHPQRAPCREKDESVLSLYLAIYRPNL